MSGKQTVTLVGTGDLELLYGVPAVTTWKWRRGNSPAAGSRDYDPQAAERSILGRRYARVSGRDVYDLDIVIERIRKRTGHEPDKQRLEEIRGRASVPADAIVAGYSEVGELLGVDQRYVRTLDQRDGKLPPPIALIGPEGRKSRIQVYAASQFARDERYSEQRATELARRHVEGP